MPKIKLVGPSQRAYALRALEAAPDNAVVSITEGKRSLDQNAKLWACLHDVSKAEPEGRKYTPEVWKALFLHSLGHQVRFEHALDGNGMVPLGFRSSQLTVPQMSDLLEVIMEYGSRHGVVWSETNRSGFMEEPK